MTIKEKIIVYGVPIIDKNLKKPTHFVTAIHIDNFQKTASFVIQKGLNVDMVKISIEECQSFGILDIEKLYNFCK